MVNSSIEPIKIIGMGMSKKSLPAAYLWIIANADILVGGQRHLDQFESFQGRKYLVDKNLSDLVQYLKKNMLCKKIVVLASGDPLFYGIGGYLIKSLGAENIEVFPNVSTVAAAFAKIKEPWQTAKVVSLHGRKSEDALFHALQSDDAVAVYTDLNKTPAWVANFLMAHKITDFNLCVLECLESPKENIDWYSIPQAAETNFQSPNLVILKRNNLSSRSNRPLYLGMPEEWFDHQNGLITKAEVRAVSLSKLRLENDHILWDLGAGSGSVSIEAAAFIRNGRIFAVEKNQKRAEQIEINRHRFAVNNLTVLCSTLPEGIEDLPAPDRIFVGGGGERLNSILQTAVRNLKPNGIIVINTVLISSMQAAFAYLQENGFKTEMIQIQVNRSHSMPFGERLEAQNPVWIISGQRLES